MLGWLVCFFHILFFSLLFSFAFVARCVYTFVFIVFLLHFQFPFSLLIFKRLEKLKWRAHFIEDVVQLFCCCCCCWNFILSHNYLYPLGGVVIWNFFFRNLLDVYRFRKFEKKKNEFPAVKNQRCKRKTFIFFLQIILVISQDPSCQNLKETSPSPQLYRNKPSSNLVGSVSIKSFSFFHTVFSI